MALPAVLAVVLWLMTTGFMVYSQGVVASTAREAARHVAIYGSGDVETIITNNLNFVVPAVSGHEASITHNNGVVEVRITADYIPFVDFSQISWLLGGNTESSNKLKAAAHFRNERPGP